MSGIAEILLELGFKVSGTDLKESSTVARLRRLGATIHIGHAAEHVAADVSLLVFSSAVQPSNPEVMVVKERGLPVIRRAEVLAELMRLKFGVAVGGSHGKTTTTTMIATMLEKGGLDPTVIIGGQVQSLETGARVGKSDYLVAESDESDRSFLLLKPTVAIVTNIDTEHLNAYENLAELEQSFFQFVDSVPFYGLAVLCIDDSRVRLLSQLTNKRKVTYGLSPDAMIRPVNIKPFHGGIAYDVTFNGEYFISIKLPVPGNHLMMNSLAAIAVGREFGISAELIATSLNAFPGVHRRLEISGIMNHVTVINDYGHHPTEIKATLSAVRAGWLDGAENPGKLHVIFQPHRYSRTRDCFVDFLTCFNEADSVQICDIYAASEEPIPGISAEVLAKAVTHPSTAYISMLDDAAAAVVKVAKPGDIVVCLGAGTVGALPSKLLELL